jgi:Holliday junction DNA helicase RuvB
MRLIGNEDILVQIDIAIKSATEENRSIPHMLMSGAAGCGKTSTARRIAEVTGGKFISVACDSVKSRADLLPVVDGFDRTGYSVYGNKLKDSHINHNIVFIDEIHGLSLIGQEHLGVLMEEWYIPVTGKEVKADPSDAFVGTVERIRWSPEFTLIGATTNDGKLSKPFRDRFKMRFVFTPYSQEESVRIALVHADRLKITLESEAALEIAKRGRGVPRVIVRLLERCRDLSLAIGRKSVTRDVAVVMFGELGIDKTGLTSTDVSMLKMMYELNEPIGLDNMAVRLNESQKVIAETIEPYLIQRGLILRSSKGRKITSEGRKYLLSNGYIKSVIDRGYVDIPKNFNRGV